MSRLSYYKLDDNLATAVVIDEEGNNNMTAGIITSSLSSASGKFGRCFDFTNLSTKYATITASPWNQLQTCSLTFWINPDTLSSRGICSNRLAAREANGMWSVTFGSNTLNIEIFWGNSGVNSHQIILNAATHGFTIGTWDMFTLTMEIGGNIKVYRNATEIYTVATSGNLSGFFRSDTPFDVGRQGNNGGYNYCDGQLDSLALYNTVLSPTEITALYNLGSGWSNVINTITSPGKVNSIESSSITSINGV